MNEAAFPLLGTLFVFLVVLPMSALVARFLLDLMDRAPRTAGVLRALNARYFLLVGSSLLPLAWLFLSLLRNGASDALLVCLFDHDAPVCSEPGVFAGLLAVGVLAAAWGRLPQTRKCQAAPIAATQLMRRISRLVDDTPALRTLNNKLILTDEPGFAVGVQGLFRHKVFIGRAYAGRLSNAALAGALAHEQEHVKAKDPLRYWLLRVALAVNPIGRHLLTAQCKRWLAAREAECDREAVLRGVRPLELAEAILVASRPFPIPTVALGASDIGILKFRVEMLLAFAEQAPSRSGWRGSSVLLCGLMLATLLLIPQMLGIGALDWFHVTVEQAVTLFRL
ncbi:MAG: hypothetical protein SFV15_16555 [Polyangiaceae bacterium]|nr:hypothetical protein [Polyangiaceae bacterium]